MDIHFSPEIEAFRRDIRQFLADKVPEDLRRRTRQEHMDLDPTRLRSWVRLLNEQGGWSCPGWPRSAGGPGWNHEQQYIFESELALNDAPRIHQAGAQLIGPALLEYGNADQQARFCPGTLNGDILWCQGYSEPNAGSDLASLKCRAERDGDEYVINGTKIWTTDGHFADWMFGLFRTDSGGKKQYGITLLLLPMSSPGIEVRPLITFDDTHEVNQVFFTDVRVPVRDRVGDEDQGWTVAKYILGFERFGTAEVSRSVASLRRLKAMAAATNVGGTSLAEDPGFSGEIAAAEMELRALELTEQRFLFGPGGPDAMGPEASMLKVRGTEIQQRVSELTMETLAYFAQPLVPEQLEDGYNEPPVGPLETGYAARSYFNQRKTSIYSGSNEIQKNIVVKAVLGL